MIVSTPAPCRLSSNKFSQTIFATIYILTLSRQKPDSSEKKKRPDASDGNRTHAFLVLMLSVALLYQQGAAACPGGGGGLLYMPSYSSLRGFYNTVQRATVYTIRTSYITHWRNTFEYHGFGYQWHHTGTLYTISSFHYHPPGEHGFGSPPPPPPPEKKTLHPGVVNTVTWGSNACTVPSTARSRR